MTSIGESEWDVTVSMDGITLEKNKTYVYSADILSDKNRNNLFIQVVNNSSAPLYSDYLIPLSANTTYKLVKIFTPTSDYSNVSIKYGLGWNNYEGATATKNMTNNITVSNSILMTLDDYEEYLATNDDIDYTSLSYTQLPVSGFSNYANYSYAKVYNIASVGSESRQDFAIDTVVINVSSSEIGKDSNNHYKVYLNGTKINPHAVEAGTWMHFDYTTLIYEYNVIKTIGINEDVATVVIKNGNVTNARVNALNTLNSISTTSQTIKNKISSLKEELENDETIAEIKATEAKFPQTDEITLEESKENAIESIADEVLTTDSDDVKDILNKAKDKINSITISQGTISALQTEIVNIKDKAILDIKKQKAIEELEAELKNIDNPSSTTTGLFNEAKTKITAATTETLVNSIRDEYQNKIVLQPKKEAAIEELEEVATTTPTSEVQKIVDDGKAAINAATTESEITTQKNVFTAKIELQLARELALDFVDIYAAGGSDEVKHLRDQAKQELNATTTDSITKITNIKNQYIEAVDTQKAKEEIESYIKEKKNYMEAFRNEASLKRENIINQKQAELYAIDPEDTTTDNKDTIKAQIDQIVLAFDNEMEFRMQKEVSMKSLEDAVKDKSSEVKKIAQTAIDAIDDDTVTTPEEVQNILDEAMEAIKLQETLEKGIEDLEKLFNDKSSKAVKEIAEKYRKLIEQETDKDEIPRLVEKAKKEIQEQLDKEAQAEKAEAAKNNPLTLDNIFNYILILLVSVIGIIVSTRYYKKLLKDN